VITIYTLTYNEELLIQFMISHYRKRFPNCAIVIYDNSSTDRTVEIAKRNNCEVRSYNTNNQLDDGLHMDIKNNCWKDSKTDWVLVCDLDELLDIYEEELKNEEILGYSIIRSEAWGMVNLEDNYNIHNIKYGNRTPSYDKDLLFNKKYIREINYGAGCHDHSPGPPEGSIVRYSNNKYKIFHYKYINPNLEVIKSKETSERLSNINKKNNWGIQCLRTEEEIRVEFEGRKKTAIKIIN